MKKFILFAVVCGLVLTACNNKPAEVEPTTDDSCVVVVDTAAPVAADTAVTVQ